jgi:hypothetical protein
VELYARGLEALRTVSPVFDLITLTHHEHLSPKQTKKLLGTTRRIVKADATLDFLRQFHGLKPITRGRSRAPKTPR